MFCPSNRMTQFRQRKAVNEKLLPVSIQIKSLALRWQCCGPSAYAFIMTTMWGLEWRKKQWPSIWMEQQNNQSCGVARRLMLHQCRVTSNCLKVSQRCVLCDKTDGNITTASKTNHNITGGEQTLYIQVFSTCEPTGQIVVLGGNGVVIHFLWYFPEMGHHAATKHAPKTKPDEITQVSVPCLFKHLQNAFISKYKLRIIEENTRVGLTMASLPQQ